MPKIGKSEPKLQANRESVVTSVWSLSEYKDVQTDPLSQTQTQGRCNLSPRKGQSNHVFVTAVFIEKHENLEQHIVICQWPADQLFSQAVGRDK